MGVTVYPEVLFPPGMVMPYAGPTAPDGWLLCDGTLVDRTTYASLYAIVGFSYSPTPGTDPGSNQFYLPNLKGRVIVMRDATQTEFDTLGKSGGSKTSTAAHTHSLSDHRHAMESHSHTFTSDYRNTNHAHNVYATGVVSTGGQSNNHAHAARTDVQQVDQGWPAAGHLAVRTTDRTPQLTWAGAIQGCSQIGNNSVYQDHTHRYDHSHPSTNYASESPWPGDYNHRHQGTTDGPGAYGGWTSPNTNVSGVSSAEASAGNLQPYMALNYLIKI